MTITRLFAATRALVKGKYIKESWAGDVNVGDDEISLQALLAEEKDLRFIEK